MKKKTRILLADNDDVFCSKVTAAFQSTENFEVVGVAEDGRKAFSAVEELHPDLLLLDLILPELDGISVLNQLYNEQITIPTIVISSFLSEQMSVECSALGVDLILRKPITAPIVRDRILLWRHFRGLSNVNKIESQNKSLEALVTEVMRQIGVPAHIKGYQYLRVAIMMAIKNMELVNVMTKELYPSVAKQFHTLSSRVERAIRHAIEVAWDRGDIDTLQHLFGYTISSAKGKPTNGEFISMIADYLRLQIQFPKAPE